MMIGTVRPEEAKVFDSMSGYHPFPTGGGFEVFWDDADTGPWSDDPRNFDAEGNPVAPGWYWWACLPGCLPDGEAHGPFASSIRAHADALDV